ncbi:hypothetical protein ILYODFUR_018148 [Ilyodon furcidens]|uniref:Ribonuclease A-domain domain-containing protein n=1 Tax=Ilyodon furcidens TaxID=33524 RepID=A0ABV0VF79_9TELE
MNEKLGGLSTSLFQHTTMRIRPVYLLVCFLQLQVAASISNKTNSCKPKEESTLEKDYEKFKSQHMAQRMAPTDCTSEIKQRNINGKRSCTATNTFILDDEKDVLAICENQGEYLNESHLTRSENTFQTVVCKHMKKNRKGSCQYTGQLRTSRIVVKCTTLPVHYQEDILTFEE